MQSRDHPAGQAGTPHGQRGQTKTISERSWCHTGKVRVATLHHGSRVPTDGQMNSGQHGQGGSDKDGEESDIEAW